MSYLWLKTLHVSAVLVWVSGLVVMSVAVAPLLPPLSEGDRALVAALRRWNRSVTTPAMLLLLGFGVAIAIQGDWLRGHWLHLKLLFVLLLFALHGVLSGGLRRLAEGRGRPAPWLRFAAPALLLLAVLIVALAIVKPF